MRIINKNKDALLAENAIIADNIFTRIKGLLGRKALAQGSALVIKPCNAIHSFFMRFPIDVLFIGDKGKTIAIKKSFKPFRLTGIYWGVKFVVELPAGVIDETSTAVGDEISLL